MSGNKTIGDDPIRRIVASKFPHSQFAEEQEPSPLQADANPLAPDRVTPNTKRLYEKFFGPTASWSVKADESTPSTSSEDKDSLSDLEGRVMMVKPAPPGRRLIKEQVLVSGGKIVALSD